ncbi:MAG: hypothetical protein WBW32_12935 [Luteibacter sp.]
MELLLKVENSFEIAGRGLALTPDLGLRPWAKDVTQEVVIELPDGSSTTSFARVAIEHFRPTGYRIVVYLPALRREEVPIGSKVFWRPER